MNTFKPLNIRGFETNGVVRTPHTRYWERLSKPDLLKEHTTVDYINFNPVEPDNFALTCSVRVQIYSVLTKLVVKNLSRFQKTAYGANFRQDGRLLVAGDEEGNLKLFDVGSKNILRLFKGHTGPVHRTFFSADMLQLASFSDDKTVRLWDVGNEKVVSVYKDAHNDYVRAGAMHPTLSSVFISGGYDGKVNFFDSRADSSIVKTVDHGCPVESMLFLPNGSIFITAGGTQIRVWDMINGYRQLASISQHHKTITCLQLGTDGQRLLSAGLDRQVKIYDISTYKTVHTLTYPNAVVSLAVAPRDQAVAVGMVDGLVSLQRMATGSKSEYAENDIEAVKAQGKLRKDATHVVRVAKNIGLKNFDHHMRKYEYKEALASVLTPNFMKKKPEVTVAIISELMKRDALRIAVDRSTEEEKVKFINFISDNISEMRFTRTLLNASNEMLVLFEGRRIGNTEVVQDAMKRLRDAVNEEIELSVQLFKLKGSLELILNNIDKDATRHVTLNTKEESSLQSSRAAKEYTVCVE